LGALGIGIAGIFTRQLENEIIERCAKVVNTIADGKREDCGEGSLDEVIALLAQRRRSHSPGHPDAEATAINVWVISG
jgi:hypothetical protein